MHYLTLLPHHPQKNHCPQQPPGPKSREPRRNKEIRQAAVNVIFNRNIQHLPQFVLTIFWLITLKNISEGSTLYVIDTQQCPAARMQHKQRKKFFLFLSLLIYLLIVLLVLIIYYYGETYLLSSDSTAYDDELSEIVMVRREERRCAKLGGEHVIAYRKFQPSGISGQVTWRVSFFSATYY